MTIRIDYTNMLADVVAGGVAPRVWQRAQEGFAEVRGRVRAITATGVHGFLGLPADESLHAEVRAIVAAVDPVDDVVVLGIGGSALGPIAMRSALLPAHWNARADLARSGYPRLHVLDNVDPRTMASLLDQLDLGRTLFVVTSKSGGTAETMAQYLVVRGRLEDAGLAPTDRIIFVTDPAKGALRALVRAEGFRSVPIPSSVGGRFSVLSPVGLLPAALVGIDTTALLAGAADMARRCETDRLEENPAGVFAVLQHAAQETEGRGVHVLMPYSDPLRDLADWFVQLWAESLGKHRQDDDAGVGPTPLASVGATDQHSQVQLFMEGPGDKTVTFIAVDEVEDDLEIPALHADIPELAYLGGHRLGDLLSIERRATAGALARRGRPNMTVHVDRVDAWHLGALFMLFEIATVIAGVLYEVDPLDQPGVELGKQFTYAMLGRADAAAARAEWDALPQPDPSRSV